MTFLMRCFHTYQKKCVINFEMTINENIDHMINHQVNLDLRKKIFINHHHQQQ